MISRQVLQGLLNQAFFTAVWVHSPLCTGDILHLYAETITNASYSWSGPNSFISSEQNPVIPDVTPINAGDYACIITVNTQTSLAAITNVIVNDLPDAMLLTTNITVCHGAQAGMPVQLNGNDPFGIIYYDGASYYTASGLTFSRW